MSTEPSLQELREKAAGYLGKNGLQSYAHFWVNHLVEFIHTLDAEETECQTCDRSLTILPFDYSAQCPECGRLEWRD